MKKVLVTGADGFIGSHLIEALIAKGYNVRALALYNSFGLWGWLENLDPTIRSQIEIIPGDVRDPFGIKEAMTGCDAVLHLAALIAIPYSYNNPASYVDTNITGTLNVVQAARDLNIERVIHTSTSEVYGTAQYVPIDEKHPLQGQSPYSATKIGADKIALSYYLSFETPVTVIRPFNTYGPRQSQRAVIPTIISQINAGQDKIKLGAISPTRDFNFVSDTVDGFIAALEAPAEKVAGQVINIGSNHEISIGDTVKLIAEIMNREIEIETDMLRIRPVDSEVERLWCDNNFAYALMKWQPKYTGADGLRQGLKQTIDWFIKPENCALYKPNEYVI